VMRSGPYKYFLHEHHFEETPEGTTYRDKLSFSSGFLGIFDSMIAKPMTNHTFCQRHQLLAQALNK
jgi:ligand-binding SRPBCC domain-containing protein